MTPRQRGPGGAARAGGGGTSARLRQAARQAACTRLASQSHYSKDLALASLAVVNVSRRSHIFIGANCVVHDS